MYNLQAVCNIHLKIWQMEPPILDSMTVDFHLCNLLYIVMRRNCYDWKLIKKIKRTNCLKYIFFTQVSTLYSMIFKKKCPCHILKFNDLVLQTLYICCSRKGEGRQFPCAEAQNSLTPDLPLMCTSLLTANSLSYQKTPPMGHYKKVMIDCKLQNWKLIFANQAYSKSCN